ncbi:CidA/LrgA family protein [Glaesserella parasuis]|nr:CidA/LrgA family protein [Glaesserella parasuis]
MLIKLLRFIIAITILFLLLYLGKVLSPLIPIRIPESILGMLMLFILFGTKIIKVSSINAEMYNVECN